MSNKDKFKELISRTIVDISIPSNITKVGDLSFMDCVNLTNVVIPERIEEIGVKAFSGCSSLTSLDIPSTVNKISGSAFTTGGASANMYLTTVIFRQPSGMTVSLPSAGQSSGMFYQKTAKEMTVYTDNETIKNYAYATDNVTATIYHLDGSAWE